MFLRSSGIQFPPTWTSTKSEKSYEKFEVQRYSAEFQTVTKAMTPDERQKYFPYIYKVFKVESNLPFSYITDLIIP